MLRGNTAEIIITGDAADERRTTTARRLRIGTWIGAPLKPPWKDSENRLQNSLCKEVEREEELEEGVGKEA